ncbi:MAG: hypothetical protein KGL39_49825 [Patescibacteria group bacterium]|nr:hypothetical protein [Patescibacteria group bacterium]
MTPQEFKQVAEWIADGVCQYNRVPGWIDWKDNYNLCLNEDFTLYRRKPQPKLRPWKPEEVPVGAIWRTPSQRCLIMAVNSDNFVVMADSRDPKVGLYEIRLLQTGEYSLDYGKTWQPCGVLE